MSDHEAILYERMDLLYERLRNQFRMLENFHAFAAHGLATYPTVAVDKGSQEFDEILGLLGGVDALPGGDSALFAQVREELIVEQTKLDTDLATSAVNSAGFVFAHSIVDDIASELCRLCAEIAPEDWLYRIQNRKVLLSQALTATPGGILKAKVNEYLEELCKESLLTRLDFLNERCQPAPKYQFEDGSSFNYSRERIQQLDERRHGIIHRLQVEAINAACAADVEFLRTTCYFLAAMVLAKYSPPGGFVKFVKLKRFRIYQRMANRLPFPEVQKKIQDAIDQTMAE